MFRASRRHSLVEVQENDLKNADAKKSRMFNGANQSRIKGWRGTFHFGVITGDKQEQPPTSTHTLV